MFRAITNIRLVKQLLQFLGCLQLREGFWGAGLGTRWVVHHR